MKTIKILYFAICVSITLVVYACSLDRNPLDQLAEKKFFETPSNSDLSLTALYRGNIKNGLEFSPSDWWSYQGLIMMEHLSDNAFDRRGVNNSLFRISNGTLEASNGVIKNYWDASYQRIGYCNRFLQGMEKQPDNKENKRMIAEAQFIRAAMYFYLASYFKDVPLVETVLSGKEANNVDKTSREKILIWCTNEFRTAAKELPSFANVLPNDKGRICKQTALAFLGRTYMLMKDWKHAATAFKEIIDMGENEINNNYAELFYPAKATENKENIFYIQYKQDFFGCGLPQHAFSAKDGGWSLVNPAADLFEAYEFKDGTSFSYDSPKFDSKHPGKNRDPRLDYTIYYNGAVFMGSEYKLSPDLQGTENLGYKEEASRTGYMMRKYFDESAPVENLRSYSAAIPIIRYAEILLSYAECINELGEMNQSVMDATINKVRGRLSVNMPFKKSHNKEKNRSIIRNERRVELAMEGIRYWDLMRWGIAHHNLSQDIWGAQCIGTLNYNSNSKKIDPTGNMRWYVATRSFRNPQDYRWPIPQAEQNINPKLREH